MPKACLLVASMVAGITGCAQSDDGGGGLEQTQVKAAGDALGNGIENSAATYGPMTGSGADSTCVTLTGDPADPDGDAIPNDATLNYDCTAQALGYTGMLTGKLNVVDDDPETLAWAFTGSADMSASLTGPGSASLTSDWTGSLVGSQVTALGPYALDRTLDVETVFASGGGDLGGARTMTTVIEDNDWTVTFTPRATWTPGGVVVDGTLDATGAWNVTVDDQTLTATLATPTALTVTPSCETLLTAGVATGSYPVEGGGTATITVTWTGCGQRSVTSTEP